MLVTSRADEPLGGAHAPARRRRRGAPARRWRSSSVRSPATTGGAARCAGRRLLPAAADRRHRHPLRGQPVLRRGAPRRRAEGDRELPAGCATCCCSASRGSTVRRRACCASPRPPGGTSPTRCCGPWSSCTTAELREGLRSAVEHGVLVADRTSGRFRFRHALLAEAIYATILPGEREELHARLADELRAQRRRLRPSWRPTGWPRVGARRPGRLGGGGAPGGGSLRSRRGAGHLERALAVWDVPDAARLVGMDLAELCSRAAEVAAEVGAAPRAVELAQRALELVGDATSCAPPPCTCASPATCS